MKKIIENDFSRIDLNLLTVLMVLYREGSVTRTAEVLHLGQPAISGALKRLREMLTTRCSCAAPEACCRRRGRKR